MTSSKNSSEPDSTAPVERDSGDESEDEEVLEESPCGRWQKRREEVKQRDVPGIDCAFLAMDTEEGVEVVWNEVRISEKKSSKSQLDKIKQVFDNLIQLEHANIVKFHKYWTDTKTDKPRVIFITEYMSSGSLRQFLKKTKMNNKTLKAWKRWCTQILSALSYLHSCEPPIVHGNLTTDTIFIQHNGLIKIGSVAPDAIYSHVKTYKEEAKNMHYIAPEYAGHDPMTTAVDIYSFGICALEMAALEIQGNGDTGNHVSEECIKKTLDTLKDPLQQDFIRKCLTKDPNIRPKARELLFHAVLFEVHSLKLLAAHTLVRNSKILSDDAYSSTAEKTVMSSMVQKGITKELTAGDANTSELEKLLEDVRNGVYPLTAFSLSHTLPSRPRAVSPELAESVKSETPEPTDTESRRVQIISCTMKKAEENPQSPLALQLTLLLRMDDKMNRQLTCEVSSDDTAQELADELVHLGFINDDDRAMLESRISEHLYGLSESSSPINGSPQLVEQRA